MNRETSFRIGDLSSLFHIGTDSIRYYEKVGLLHPVRDEDNGYRLYTLDDIRTMNTIRELLDLGFSTEEILDFEKDRNLAHVTQMLEKEEEILDRKIEDLTLRLQNIRGRLHAIRASLALDCSGKVREVRMPLRHILMVTDTDIPDDMINYVLAEYLRMLRESRQDASRRGAASPDSSVSRDSGSSPLPEDGTEKGRAAGGPSRSSSLQKDASACPSRTDTISTIGACDCYTLDISALNADGSDYRTKNVFFYAPYLKLACNRTLPAGLYLSACYRGAFSHTRELVPQMYRYAEEHHLRVIGDPMEFCHIDRYETANKDEYLTELQLQVADPADESGSPSDVIEPLKPQG